MKRLIYRIGKFIKPMTPNLPTDNLYKFCFVGGLFVLIFLSYQFLIFEREHQSKKFELELQSAILDIEYNNIDSALVFIIDVLKSQTNNESLIMAENKLEKIEDKKKDLDSKLVINNKLIQGFNDSDLGINKYRTIFIVLITLSLTFTIYSASLWYHRVQIHEDKILRERAEVIP